MKYTIESHPHAKVYLDGEEVSKRAFAADDELHYVNAFELDESGRIRQDPFTGIPLVVQLRGQVRVELQTMMPAAIERQVRQDLRNSNRRFYLWRKEDQSGVSGCGVVATGIQFRNGWVAMTWLTEHSSVVFYPNIEDAIAVHGHGGKTEFVWLDE